MARLMASLTCFFPEFAAQASETAVGIVREAYEVADETYGLAAAAAWAGGYQIPEEMVQADVEKFKRLGYSLEAMAQIGR